MHKMVKRIFKTAAGQAAQYIKWIMGLPDELATFTCTSGREIWGYVGDPSAANPPRLITVGANVQGITGARWDGSKFVLVMTDGVTKLGPYRQDPAGRVYSAFANYAVSTAYAAGVQVKIKTAAGNYVYMTSSGGTSDASAVVVADSDIGGTVADNDITWTVQGYATIEGNVLEGAATKRGLWNRDLTNVVWAKTNITAAKDATGAKADATSASTLTATANAGTILQTVTIASAAFAFAPYVKRKTGTGTVEVTIDNGGTWVDITADINSSYWVRALATKTAANPIFGFRLGTDTDEIEVDFCDMEAGTGGTSPQIVTSGNVVRDASSFSNPSAGVLSASSLAGRIVFDPAAIVASPYLFYSSQDNNNQVFVFATATQVRLVKKIAGVSHQAIETYTIKQGVLVQVEFRQNTVGGGDVRAFDFGTDPAGVAWSNSADTDPAVIGTDYFIGSQGGTTQHQPGNFLSVELSDNAEDLNFVE